MIPINCKITNFSLYLSLLSLKHNSGQAASLHPIFPNLLPPLPFLHTQSHTRQTARANNGCSSMHTSNKHIEHSVSYIHSIKAIRNLVAFFQFCLFLWCTSTEYVKHRLAYMQWAYWAPCVSWYLCTDPWLDLQNLSIGVQGEYRQEIPWWFCRKPGEPYSSRNSVG